MGHYQDILARWDEASIAETGNRTFVTLSFAQSLDGSVSLKTGERTRLSNDHSWEMTHALRARHDAIVVGVGTVLVDDPRLTVRLTTKQAEPIRVVLDRHLRTPPDAQIFSCAGGPVQILCDEAASQERENALRSSGATVFRCPSHKLGHEQLSGCFWELGIRKAMVEGGAAVISGFLNARSADYTVLTLVPLLSAHRDTVRYGQGQRSYTYDLAHCNQTLIDRDVILDGPLR